MSICPVCNGFSNINAICSYCGNKLIDEGRMSDYFDDYSPYMEIDLMRVEDGYSQNYQYGQCYHLLQCPSCGRQETYVVQE